MTLTVRPAMLAEVSALVAWGKDAHDRSNYAGCAPFNAVVTRQFFKGALSDPNHAFFVAKDGQAVKGLLIGHCDLYPFSHARFATDVLFVADAGGDALLDAFIAWAQRKRVAIIESAPSQSDRFRALARLLRSRGFIRCGGTFRKILSEVVA